MNPTSNISIVSTNSNEQFFVNQNELLFQFVQFILDELMEWVGSQKGAFYFIDANGNLEKFCSNNHIDADFLSLYIYETKTSHLIKKGSRLPHSEKIADETYIACFIGDEKLNLNLGVLVLEGIKNFENFSLTDFEMINEYCSNLTLILNNAYWLEDSNEIYLKFVTSIFLLSNLTKTHQKNSRLEFWLKEVIRVSGLINSSHHLTKLLRDVMESVKSVFRTESCSILLVDKKKNDLYFHIIAGEKEDEYTKIRVPMGQGIAGTVALTRTPMIINDAQNDNRVYKVADQTTGFITRNILAAPLIVGNEVVGVMEAINTIDRNNFNENDIDLFLSFSDAAAIAIQKARLVDNLEQANLELEKKVSELESLFEVGQLVLVSKTESELFENCIKILTRELQTHRAGIILIDEKQKKLNILSYIYKKLQKKSTDFLRDSVILHAIIDNRIVLKKEHNNVVEMDDLDEEFLVGSYIILPMTGSDKKPFGAICISESTHEQEFNQNHLRLLQTISSQIIKGYENIKLNQDIIAKKAMEKEIEITRNIQKNILPSTTQLPTGSNFEIGIMSTPAKEVSGDFFDYYKYDDGQYSFLIADVSGKSLPAAIFMAMSSSVMRTLSRDHKLSPAELLFEANKLIYEDSQSGMFVTLFFIHYNPAQSEIHFASAGHNNQIWIKSDGSFEYIKGAGTPLGVIPIGKYIGGKFQPQDGDMMILYTDGAIEQKNLADEEFGLDRFMDEIIKRKDKHPKQIIEEVYKLIMDFSENDEQFDDFTVMILKFNDNYQFTRTFPAVRSSIPKLRDFIEGTIKVRELDEIINDDILLSCDEAATNIIMHSFKDTTLKNPTFECQIKFKEDTVDILLKDKGKPFEREKVQKPSIEANLKGERKGGFGVYLVEKLMDKVEYYREVDTNHLFIQKKIPKTI